MMALCLTLSALIYAAVTDSDCRIIKNIAAYLFTVTWNIKISIFYIEDTAFKAAALS